MKKEVETLRTFFRLSNATFDFKDVIQVLFIGRPSLDRMQELHRAALLEIEKENPDLKIIYKLISEMEQEAEKNRKQ